MGPVGTGETSASFGTTGVAQRLSPVNWSMVLNRQEALVSIVTKPVFACCGSLLYSSFEENVNRCLSLFLFVGQQCQLSQLNINHSKDKVLNKNHVTC